MNKLLLASLLLFANYNAKAQMPVNLARIDTLANDVNNSEFHFETLKEKFKQIHKNLVIINCKSCIINPSMK